MDVNRDISLWFVSVVSPSMDVGMLELIIHLYRLRLIVDSETSYSEENNWWGWCNVMVEVV